jgi:hypothetical protein
LISFWLVMLGGSGEGVLDEHRKVTVGLLAPYVDVLKSECTKRSGTAGAQLEDVEHRFAVRVSGRPRERTRVVLGLARHRSR